MVAIQDHHKQIHSDCRRFVVRNKHDSYSTKVSIKAFTKVSAKVCFKVSIKVSTKVPATSFTKVRSKASAKVPVKVTTRDVLYLSVIV